MNIITCAYNGEEILEMFNKMSAMKAEIERLKAEHSDTLDRLLDGVIPELIQRGMFYQSRAAAWKRCALMWRDDLEVSSPVVGNPRAFWAHRFEFEGEIGNRRIIDWATTRITKAPPDWREKWVLTKDKENTK